MHSHILAGDHGYLPSYASERIELKDSDNAMQEYLKHLRDSIEVEISEIYSANHFFVLPIPDCIAVFDGL